jgi:hypothetical protein
MHALHNLSSRHTTTHTNNITIMKLSSFTLLLALVPFSNAVVDSPPNLRGIAVALTDGDTTPIHGAPTCKQEDRPCDHNASDNGGCCTTGQYGLTVDLICKATGDQYGPPHKCTRPPDTSSTSDEIDGVALTNEQVLSMTQAPPGSATPGSTAPGGGRNGAPCRGIGLDCSTSANSPVTHTCCKSESMNLTCNKDDSVAAQSSTFDGKCENVSSSGDKCFDFYQKKIKCEDDSNEPDVDICKNHPSFPDDANCHVICNYHYELGTYICSQGGGDDEEDK